MVIINTFKKLMLKVLSFILGPMINKYIPKKGKVFSYRKAKNVNEDLLYIIPTVWTLSFMMRMPW